MIILTPSLTDMHAQSISTHPVFFNHVSKLVEIYENMFSDTSENLNETTVEHKIISRSKRAPARFMIFLHVKKLKIRFLYKWP